MNMTPEQALEVLKRMSDYHYKIFGVDNDVQALTIAIEVMEASINPPIRLDQTTLINPNTPIR